jgi:Sulfotransferase family
MKPVRAELRQLGFRVVRHGLRSIGIRPPRIVFIMGHMRSGSTLLMHILVSNPEIIGCGERNVPYRSTDDLDKLEIAARRSQSSLFGRVAHVVDQINHDEVTPVPDLFNSERVRCIFLVREPEEAIQSLLRLTQPSSDPWSVERAIDYYVGRLESLTAFRERTGGRAIALTYSELVDDVPETLKRLTSFLSLSEPLRPEYSIQRFTGRRGDTSDRIRSGRIVRGTFQGTFPISECQRQKLNEAYWSCLAEIM